MPTRAPVPARPSLERPLSPAPRSGGTRPSWGREAGRSAYLDQLLARQSRAGGWRRSRRVVVRVFQIVSGEERRVADRVRSAQHRLELREHGLVLRGRRLGHWSQAGAHGQHPRGHGRSGDYGSGAPGDRDSHLAGAGTGRRTRRGAAAGDPWAGSQTLKKAGTKIGAPGLGHASPPMYSDRHFLPPRPSARSLARSLAGTAPATSKLHQQAKRARTCPATTDT